MTAGKLLLIWGSCWLAAAAFAQSGVIQLSAFPSVMAADGRSTMTVTAEVRDNGGSAVPDGTQVVFETSLGRFRETTMRTQGGFARAVLQAGSIAGSAKVRASVLPLNAFSEIDIEFVADRSMLDAARDYIEVVGQTSLQYSLQDRIIEATGSDRGVSLRYRDIVIRADDMQVRVPTYEVRARNALLIIGGHERTYEELYFRLNHRKGSGVTTIQQEAPRIVSNGLFATVRMEPRERIGAVEVTPTADTPMTTAVDRRLFNFQDISLSLSSVVAKRAVAFPLKEVQFQRASVRVNGLTVLRLPLFLVSVNTASPLITQQFFNISNNNLAVNFPHYLSLGPGHSSLVRLRHGSRYGSGVGASQGTFLDYELRWNRGAQMDGGLTVSGLARDDWGLGLRQYWQTDDRTSITAQLDFPAHRNLFANVGLNRSFDGFQLSASGQHGRSIDGNRFTSNNYSLTMEADPVRTRGLPAQAFFGVTANSQSFTGGGFTTRQEGVGLQARFIGDPIRLGGQNSLTATYTASYLSGRGLRNGLSHFATLSANAAVGPVFLSTTLDYVEDGLSDQFLGRFRLTSEGFYQVGSLGFRAFVAQSLDIDRLNANIRVNYRLSPKWRLNYTYYIDQFEGSAFLDQTVVLGYRIGFQEVGLSYSARTGRIGLEILGASFD